MDPPSQPPAQPAASATTAATNKLRLMCSYGGHITQRPQSNSLYYAGGETRLISIPDSSNLTLSSLISHLASSLHFTNHPFTLKYQLPNHDLDSLISLSSDEDLFLMLDGLRRLARSPSRIRLFVFPRKSVSSPPFDSKLGNELRHPMTETWFADVLKSTKLMQKGGVGFGGDDGNCGGGEAGGVLCGAESMVLETSSSLGSSNSAVSFPNFPSKGQSEDHSVKMPLSDSIASDNTVATAVSHPQTGFYQEPVTAPFTWENKNPMAAFQYGHPQQAQYVQTTASHYVPQNPAGITPMSPYYVVGSPVPPQQMYYQPNQPHPVYFVPVGNPYNFPVQSSFITPNVSSNRPPAHPNPSSLQVAYKAAADPHVNLPLYENHHYAGMNVQAQPIGINSLEAANYGSELDDDNGDDDVGRAQIYKSQPSGPSQYQTMNKATAEALAQLHMDNNEQQ